MTAKTQGNMPELLDQVDRAGPNYLGRRETVVGLLGELAEQYRQSLEVVAGGGSTEEASRDDLEKTRALARVFSGRDHRYVAQSPWHQGGGMAEHLRHTLGVDAETHEEVVFRALESFRRDIYAPLMSGAASGGSPKATASAVNGVIGRYADMLMGSS